VSELPDEPRVNRFELTIVAEAEVIKAQPEPEPEEEVES